MGKADVVAGFGMHLGKESFLRKLEIEELSFGGEKRRAGLEAGHARNVVGRFDEDLEGMQFFLKNGKEFWGDAVGTLDFSNRPEEGEIFRVAIGITEAVDLPAKRGEIAGVGRSLAEVGILGVGTGGH